MDGLFVPLADIAGTMGWHVEVIASIDLLLAAAEVLAHSAVPVVIDHYGVYGRATPQSEAGRRLLEILVEIGEGRKLLLTPPAIVTPESFPELLYVAKWPFADVLTQQLAWVEALRGTEATLRAVDEAAPRLVRALVLPGCGHWTQQERPDEVNRELLDFLAALEI